MFFNILSRSLLTIGQGCILSPPFTQGNIYCHSFQQNCLIYWAASLVPQEGSHHVYCCVCLALLCKANKIQGTVSATQPKATGQGDLPHLASSGLSQEVMAISYPKALPLLHSPARILIPTHLGRFYPSLSCNAIILRRHCEILESTHNTTLVNIQDCPEAHMERFLFQLQCQCFSTMNSTNQPDAILTGM